MRVRVRRVCTGLALLGLALTGCAALPGFGPPPVDTYELTAPVPPAEGRRLRRTQILIAEPAALQSLDGQDIVIKTAPGAIQFLQGARWADRLPRIIQARLAETFQLTNRFGGVGLPGEGLAIDYQVIADIRAFEIRVDGPERAVAEIFVRVLDDRNGVVRASRSFTTSALVGGSGNDAFVAALDRAFDAAAIEIVNWATSVM